MPASETRLSTVPSGASLERRHELFDSVWRSWRAGAPLPRWQDFLPASEESCTSEYVQLLLGMDIEYRVKAGQPALLAEPYFQHDRLLRPDARLDDEQQRELIRWEYQQRWQKALAISQTLVDDFPVVPDYRQNLASIHNNLANLLRDQNQPDKSAQQYRKALAIRQKLVDEFPPIPDYRRDLVSSHNNLGILLAGQNQPEQAADQFRKSLAISQKLVDNFPAVPQYRQYLADSHLNLGNLLWGQNQPEHAAEHFRKALATYEKLADDFPAVTAYRQDLASSHNNLGILLKDQKQLDKARDQHRKALDIQQKLADDFPGVTAYQVELGGSCCNYGNLLLSSSKSAESLPWYDKAIRALTPVHQQDPRSVLPRMFLRNSHAGRAWAYDRLEKHAAAVTDWNRVIELSPASEQPGYRAKRASSRVRMGRVASAVVEVAELTKADTWDAGAWYDFACIYAVAASKDAGKKKEYADRAMELLQRAVKAGYKDAAHMAKDMDLDVLRQREDFKKLMEALAKAKEKKQRDGEAKKK
jgi:tetratricopeptide (TPR) repeat protein